MRKRNKASFKYNRRWYRVVMVTESKGVIKWEAKGKPRLLHFEIVGGDIDYDKAAAEALGLNPRTESAVTTTAIDKLYI